MATDKHTGDTARWSVPERIQLAEALARIEASLKNQDEVLDDLSDHAKAMAVRVTKAERVGAKNEGRISAHEKIVAAIVGTVSFFVGIYKAFF